MACSRMGDVSSNNYKDYELGVVDWGEFSMACLLKFSLRPFVSALHDKHLLFPSSCELLFCPLKSQISAPFLSALNNT